MALRPRPRYTMQSMEDLKVPGFGNGIQKLQHERLIVSNSATVQTPSANFNPGWHGTENLGHE